MPEADRYANDPFFKRANDAEWNACIGRQGHEENYVDGYIEAAIELADAVLEKKMYAKRDTLVLPILYNARHALELVLKFATVRLVRAGAVKDDGRKADHNIKVYLDCLEVCGIGDEKLSQTIFGLKPYIDSLSRIDSDGQELRYHRNRDANLSLEGYSLANLEVIQNGLQELQNLLSALKYRTLDFVDERATGTFTNRCSRKDLLAIARLLPRRDDWTAEEFDQQKALVKKRYGLGNTQFAIALNTIQKNREMRAILGIESPLMYLKDDDIVWVVEKWRHLHPRQEQNQDNLGVRVDKLDEAYFTAMNRQTELRGEIGRAISARLAPEAVADLEVLFYLGRDGLFTEYYETEVERVRKQHTAAKNPQQEIDHLVGKPNFLLCLQESAPRLGRLSVWEKLKAL